MGKRIASNNWTPRVGWDFLNDEKTRPYTVPNLFLTLSIKWRVKLTKESLKNCRSQWAIVKYPLAFRNKHTGTPSYSFFSSQG